jgi:hypothetical protein
MGITHVRSFFMLVSRTSLYKQIKVMEAFDSTGSPFVGLQWGESAPLFHRSSSTGYIETVGYRAAAPDLIVSISHLREMLSRFEDDDLVLGETRSPGLTINTASNAYETRLHVHTVRPNVTWHKAHHPGKQTVALDTAGFAGINTSPFTLATPPVLRQGKLMLATDFGIIMRSQVPVNAFPYPRDTFLRTVAPMSISSLYLTENGYWGAEAGGFRVMVSGHRWGDPLFDLYNRGAETVAELPAARLTYALAHASAIAANKSRVTLDPTDGILVNDIFGNADKFSIGATTGWKRFAIPAGTASVLAGVLKQDSSDTALLQQVDPETLRITRGLWELSFKFYGLDSKSRDSGL